ncbi:MAG: hypothetical protein VX294_00035 [Candidatus Latescibacterota bacterium]|nr:hypothetical protein [Candidatus Latescibacterota bacterium]
MAKKIVKRKNHPITGKGVERAIYFDFEGLGPSKNNPDPPPLLAGVLCEGDYQVFVLDTQLSDLTNEQEIRYQSLEKFCSTVLSKARQEDRRLICWSWYDLEVFRNQNFPPENIGFDVKIPFDKERKKDSTLKKVYQDYKKNKDKYRQKGLAAATKKALRPKAHSLLTLVAAALGKPRPPSFGAGLVGKWLRSMIAQSQRQVPYQSWWPSAIKNVRKLLNHNRHDCCATKYVLKKLLDMGIRHGKSQ